MIFDTLENLPKYAGLLKGLDTVIRCMKSGEPDEKGAGSYKTEDPNCRYNIGEYEPCADGKRFEIHHREADVQIMLKGSEVMEYTSAALCQNADAYDEQKDVFFADGKTLLRFTAVPGTFVIFFAGEPHKPGLPVSTPEKVKKVIFKIKN